MLAALVVASMGLSFAGLDAKPPSFAGFDARPVVRPASFVRPSVPLVSSDIRPAVYAAPAVYYYPAARPVYVGGFYASYGYSAGSCASGNCARR